MELNDRLLINTYFRIDSGYDPYKKSSSEDMFWDEITQLFESNQFGIKQIKGSKTCDLTLCRTRLHCHPQELVGCTEVKHIPLIERILSNGKTFRYLGLDQYGKIYDLTPGEECEYYRQQYDSAIRATIFNRFRTKRSSLFRDRSLIRQIAQEINLHTPEHTSFNECVPSYSYIHGHYRKMVEEGLLLEGVKYFKDDTIQLCRSRNSVELKSLGLARP